MRRRTVSEVNAMQRVGLDLGYGWVKVVNEEGERWAFPSVVARKLGPDPGEVLPGRRATGLRVDQLEAAVKPLQPRPEAEETYLVGALALRAPQPTRPFADDKAHALGTQVLTAVALALAMRRHGEDIHLATGLPYAQFVRREARRGLIQALEGREWVVRFPRAGNVARRVRIGRVTVYPQAVGALYAFLSSGHPEAETLVREGGAVGLIDIGTKTTDFVVVDLPEMEFRADLCGTVPVGMSSVHAAVRAHIEQRTGLILDEAQVEQAVLAGELRTRHGILDLRDVIQREYRALAEQIANRLEIRWQQRGLYRHIVLAGGGAEPLAEALKAFDAAMQPVPRAQFANAEGYLVMLRLEERAQTGAGVMAP